MARRGVSVTRCVEGILREFKAGLERLYGPRLRGVYLYGSYARGEADAESDLDVLIVLTDFDRYGAEVERTGGLGADLSLACGVSLSQVFVRERDWLRGDTTFLANVRQEAVSA
jgi:predicted nucleotidyltransferase